MNKILTIYFFKKIQVLWQSWVYQTKSVENKTWNICNSLKSENMTSLVETNTSKFSSDRARYIKQKVRKTKLEIFAIPWNQKKWQVMWKPILRKFSSDRAGYIKQKVWKQNLKYLQFLEIRKNYKSCWNQYFEKFCLTEQGISNKKCGKQNLEYFVNHT